MIKRFTRSATPLALAMALAGCMSLAPKYERPAAPVAASFPELAPAPPPARPRPASRGSASLPTRA